MLVALAKRLPQGVQDVLREARHLSDKIANRSRRRSIALAYYWPRLKLIDRWIWKDTEVSNFYYKLTPLNQEHLAHVVASVTGERYGNVQAYFSELDGDRELREHMERALRTTYYGRDIEFDYGRRLAWYALVRILKPKVVVETGVDHGVGACVVASALLRNRDDGFAGSYFGTEIRTEAGKLFCGRYASAGKILYGDSIQTLETFDQPIDLFINDSDHSADYEYREYLTIAAKLSPAAIILGDNSHVSDSLSRFSLEHGRKFLFFAECPANHWYPGAGVGISFVEFSPTRQ